MGYSWHVVEITGSLGGSLHPKPQESGWLLCTQTIRQEWFTMFCSEKGGNPMNKLTFIITVSICGLHLQIHRDPSRSLIDQADQCGGAQGHMEGQDSGKKGHI